MKRVEFFHAARICPFVAVVVEVSAGVACGTAPRPCGGDPASTRTQWDWVDRSVIPASAGLPASTGFTLKRCTK